MATHYRLYRQSAHACDQWAPAFDAIELADNAFKRLRGLLGRRGLDEQQGLLISPCHRVHTLGMRFVLDVAFIDQRGTVVRCVPALKPNRQAGARGARHTLELAAGSLARSGLCTGDRVKWEPAA